MLAVAEVIELCKARQANTKDHEDLAIGSDLK